MKLPRVQFTVRRSMIVVAILAVLCGSAARRQEFLRVANRHGTIACPAPNCTPGQVQRIMRANEYNQAMYRKYRLAAWLPFLPVMPDPPPPG
jgi:hypothetical protein